MHPACRQRQDAKRPFYTILVDCVHTVPHQFAYLIYLPKAYSHCNPRFVSVFFISSSVPCFFFPTDTMPPVCTVDKTLTSLSSTHWIATLSYFCLPFFLWTWKVGPTFSVRLDCTTWTYAFLGQKFNEESGSIVVVRVQNMIFTKIPFHQLYDCFIKA